MAVIKGVKSGKAVQFIDDYGHVYSISIKSVLNVCNGVMKSPCMLVRMPFDVSPTRFGRSKVWSNGVLITADEFDVTVREQQKEGITVLGQDYMTLMKEKDTGKVSDIKDTMDW